jgi:RNA polymerase sigma-70 factor (ECF subfamily)
MELTRRHELLRAAISHARELTQFLRRQVSNAHDAQDLMQELYLAAMKVQHSHAIQHPKAYLFRIARNLVHQHHARRKLRPPHIALDEVWTEVLQTAHAVSEANAPESEAALAERLTQLERRLNELSPRVQAAVVWHHRDGYTCDEISKKLSVVTHRVKKYLVRGLTHCRALPMVGPADSPS